MGNSFIFDDEEQPEQPEGDIYAQPEAEPTGDEQGPEEGGNNRTFLVAIGILGGIVLLALVCLAVYAGFVLPRQKQAATVQQAQQMAQNTQIAQAATATALAGSGLSQGPTYIVQPGDTLAAIAARFAISVDDLRNANPGLGAVLTPGQAINIPPLYIAQPGDTLAAIAARLGIAVEILRNANPGVGDNPAPGQAIKLPAVGSLITPAAPAATNTPVVVFASSTPVLVATVDPLTATVAAAYTQAAVSQLTVIPTSTALGAVPSTGFADEVGLPVLFIAGAIFLVVIFLVRRMRTARAS
jgi:LysM repeat protein